MIINYRTPRPKVVGYFFAWRRRRLPGSRDLGSQRCRSSQSDHSVTSACISFFSPGMQPPPSRCKVAEVRKATTPLLLQQGSNFLIRRCKALRQTSTHQESFSLRGQNEGAEVVGRTKLADQTTFKQI